MENLKDDVLNGFFKPIGNDKPYFKAAFEGEPGTGKSWTTALVAIGLHQRIKSTKPIAIFDTEKASKFLVSLFEQNGIQAIVKESQSLADLKKTMELCANGVADILIIDSITGVWQDFQDAYKKKLNRTLLQIQDWMTVKAEWNRHFSTPLVQFPVHILATGRVSDRMEQEIDEETGRKEFTKTGVKMQAEKNAAYEFDILVLMERHELITKRKREIWRQASVLKGRGGLLDGAVFKNPTYENFAPAIDAIMKNPVEARTDMAQTDAASLIKTEEDKREYIKRRDIALEKIEAYLVSVWPGASAENKQLKVKALEYAFNTPSWTEISGKNPTDLEDGILKLHEFVKVKIAANNYEKKEMEKLQEEPKMNMSRELKATSKTLKKP